MRSAGVLTRARKATRKSVALTRRPTLGHVECSEIGRGAAAARRGDERDVLGSRRTGLRRRQEQDAEVDMSTG